MWANFHQRMMAFRMSKGGIEAFGGIRWNNESWVVAEVGCGVSIVL